MIARSTMMSGFFWRSVGITGQRLLSFVVLAVLARLLSIQEFGTAATATMIVLLLQPITRFGVYDFLIQKEHVDQTTKTAALVVSYMFGSTLFVIITLSAPVVSKALANEQLVPALRLLGLIFLFGPVSTVQEGLLTKNFRFGTIAACQIAAFVPSGFIGILLALLNYGTFSIVVQQIVYFGLMSLLMWLADPWRPVLHGSGREMPQIVKMGASYTLGQALSSINSNLFGLVVAFVSGTDAAGVFRIAWAGLLLCINLTIHPALNVAQPLFAARRQDPNVLRTTYLKVLRYFSALALPAFAFVGACAPELVTLAFGYRWSHAGTALAIMSLFVLAGGPNLLLRSFLNAVGKPKQALMLAVMETVFSLVLLLMLAPLGTNGVACAVVLRSWASMPITFHMVSRYANANAKDVLKTMAPSILSAAVLAAGILFIKGLVLQDRALPTIIGASMVIALVSYALMMWLLDRILVREVVEFAGEVARHIPTRRR